MSVYKFGGESTKDSDKLKWDDILKRVERNYLKRDGSSGATGPLDMNNNKISRVIDPLVDKDVATKKYVDDRTSIKANKILEPAGGNVLVSTANGGMLESYIKIDKVATDIANSKREGYFIVSGKNGKIVESDRNIAFRHIHRVTDRLERELNRIKTIIASSNTVQLSGKIRRDRVLEFLAGTYGDFRVPHNYKHKIKNIRGNKVVLILMESPSFTIAEEITILIDLNVGPTKKYTFIIRGGTSGSIPIARVFVPLEFNNPFSLKIKVIAPSSEINFTMWLITFPLTQPSSELDETDSLASLDLSDFRN